MISNPTYCHHLHTFIRGKNFQYYIINSHAGDHSVGGHPSSESKRGMIETETSSRGETMVY